MDTQNENREMLSPYVSVDCVLLGINDEAHRAVGGAKK